jgi:hypothetical protein
MKVTALVIVILSVVALAVDAQASSPSNETFFDSNSTEVESVSDVDNFAPSASPSATPGEPTPVIPEVVTTGAPIESAPFTAAPLAAPFTAAPLAAPITASPVSASPSTDMPSDLPSPGPTEIQGETTPPEQETETIEPTPTPPPEAAAQEVIPTVSPVAAEPEDSLPSDMPSDAPSMSPSAAPFGAEVVVSASCSATPACFNLSLEGDCCPTVQNWTLACCGGPELPVEVQCAANDQCAALGLEGACCPTNDPNVPAYLDCCTVLPDECIDASTCKVRSAVEYKLELDQKKAREQSGAIRLESMIATALALVLVAIL